MTASLSNPYTRRRACKSCPFLRSGVGIVRTDRAKQIADDIRAGGGFTCHQTLVLDEADDEMEQMVPGPNAQECAGALLTLRNGGETNQLTRIAERIGLYDESQIADADVFSSLTEWVKAHREPTELEHCGVTGPDCEDPYGYMTTGGAIESTDEPTCDPDNCCQGCGNTMCEACTSTHAEEPLCVHCASDWSDDDGD